MTEPTPAPTSAPMHIAIAGEALLDFAALPDAPHGLHHFAAHPGGSPANTAIAAARLGQPTALVGQLSRDMFGELLLAHLQDNGVDTRHVLRSDAPSSLAFVERHPGGNNRYSFYLKDTADTLWNPVPRPALPPECRFLQFGSTVLVVPPVATHLTQWMRAERQAGAGRRILVLDPNVRPALIDDAVAWRRDCRQHLALADLIKLSDEDLAFIAPGKSPEQAAAHCLAHGARALVLTRGERGASVFRLGRETIHAQPPRVDVVDTIGAGDSFGAALLVALLEQGVTEPEGLENLSNEAWQHVLHFASRAAAINCTRAGAQPPSREELEAFQA